MFLNKKSAWIIGFSAIGLTLSCTTKFGQDTAAKIKSSRGIATINSEAESCESSASKDWFNEGKYTVSETKTSEQTEPFNFAAYDPTFQPSRGKNTETWSSKVSEGESRPSNRKDFFSRGTMYYFEVKGMDDEYKGTESNFKLIGPRVVGTDSEINVYRIDKLGNGKDLEECPSVDKKYLVATIPFFSLRTSGNRTNQMPKSSFKIKTLSAKKWKKMAETQYDENIEILKKAPNEVNSLALAFQDLMGKEVIDKNDLDSLRGDSKEKFMKWFAAETAHLSGEQQWKAGQLRNGMLWWKGQLEYAASIVSRNDIDEIQTEMKTEESAKILKAAKKELADKGWEEKVDIRVNQASKSTPEDFLGMDSINLKAMWNDPSQMREALAWYMFEKGGVPAPRHTYAKLCFGKTYRGLFSVVEQIDETFIEDRKLAKNPKTTNIYKVYMGTEDVGLETKDLENAFAKLDLTKIKDGEIEKMKVMNAFIDNPIRGEKALSNSPFASQQPFAMWLKESQFFFKNLGGGTLQKLTKDSNSQISPYFKASTIESRTYQLQTDWEKIFADRYEEEILPNDSDYEKNEKKMKKRKFKNWQKEMTAQYLQKEFFQKLPPASRYTDIEVLIEAINSGNYESEAYFQRMNQVLDTKMFLRWAALTVLLGGWDNYYMNPQNFYLFNQTPYTTAGKSGGQPKFIVLPWDYDQSFSMSFGERANLWWNTDILNWESMRGEKRPDKGGLDEQTKEEYASLVQRPLITNMLKNKRFRNYYLKYIDWMIYNYFHVDNVVSLIGKGFPLKKDDLQIWQKNYKSEIDARQRQHANRLSKEIWDDPTVNVENFQEKLNDRLVREISNPESHRDWFKGVSPKSNEEHLQWEDFQTALDQKAAFGKIESAASFDRCDQETYVEPRSSKDVGQCEERTSLLTPVYPTGWSHTKAKKEGIWNLIGKAVYEENMGLPRPRWDIMSRTGRQYRNALIYDNGFLGRRVVWKELWQESPEKCNRQYKIFEGIEHHVRERARTALKQISLASPYSPKEDRAAILGESVDEIPF